MAVNKDDQKINTTQYRSLNYDLDDKLNNSKS
jgi:hypothetical protein